MSCYVTNKNSAPMHTKFDGKNAQKLYASVVLAAISDAVEQENKDGSGADALVRWAKSHDGRSVLCWAGIDPSDRVHKLIEQAVIDGARAKRIRLFARASSQPRKLLAA